MTSDDDLLKTVYGSIYYIIIISKDKVKILYHKNIVLGRYSTYILNIVQFNIFIGMIEKKILCDYRGSGFYNMKMCR